MIDVSSKAKVFCIGFHKTGTTSLEMALKQLGYRVTGCFGTKDPEIASKVHELAYARAEKFDAFEDNPWPVLYRELDERFPGSKFILTRRPAESWIRSQVKDFASTETPMRRLLQGDVGCGKTAVALVACAQVAGGNAQTVFLAPTELLAEQHAETAMRMLQAIGAGLDRHAPCHFTHWN